MISRFSKQHSGETHFFVVMPATIHQKKNMFLQKCILKILKSWKYNLPFKIGDLEGVFSFP
jgi:hypothetical protein